MTKYLSKYSLQALTYSIEKYSLKNVKDYWLLAMFCRVTSMGRILI